MLAYFVLVFFPANRGSTIENWFWKLRIFKCDQKSIFSLGLQQTKIEIE